MGSAYDLLAAYHRSGRPLSCGLGVEPWICEFWPIGEVNQRNSDYEVSTNAPGYLGFASSGGGEMYAISPAGARFSRLNSEMRSCPATAASGAQGLAANAVTGCGRGSSLSVNGGRFPGIAGAPAGLLRSLQW